MLIKPRATGAAREGETGREWLKWSGSGLNSQRWSVAVWRWWCPNDRCTSTGQGNCDSRRENLGHGQGDTPRGNHTEHPGDQPPGAIAHLATCRLLRLPSVVDNVGLFSRMKLKERDRNYCNFGVNYDVSMEVEVEATHSVMIRAVQDSTTFSQRPTEGWSGGMMGDRSWRLIAWMLSVIAVGSVPLTMAQVLPPGIAVSLPCGGAPIIGTPPSPDCNTPSL
jgi:hypothetical protein